MLVVVSPQPTTPTAAAIQPVTAADLGPSWLDGKPSLIMDYCGTSHVWRDVRDEVREVAPGLFVGVMFRRDPCGPKFEMFFVLEAASCGKCGSAH